MRRVGRRGLEAAQQLVLALRAGLEQRKLLVDRALDAGVVRGLEVQEVDVDVGAPVAAVQRRVGLEEQRAGDALAAGDDLDHAHRVGQRLASAWKKPGRR